MDGVNLEIAGASRPLPGEKENGDGWRVDWHDGTCRIAVVDGLGHGSVAARITERAMEALAAHPSLTPLPSLRVCHDALLGTRGAVISIALIDAEARNLVFAGIGNVDARLWQPDRERRPIPYRGIVGGPSRTVRTIELTLGDEWLLLMHTDGVSGRLQLEQVRLRFGGRLDEMADFILREWARPTDDASVVLVGPSPVGLPTRIGADGD